MVKEWIGSVYVWARVCFWNTVRERMTILDAFLKHFGSYELFFFLAESIKSVKMEFIMLTFLIFLFFLFFNPKFLKGEASFFVWLIFYCIWFHWEQVTNDLYWIQPAGGDQNVKALLLWSFLFFDPYIKSMETGRFIKSE